MLFLFLQFAMIEHFFWQPLSVLCQPADAIAATFTTAVPAASRSKAKDRGRGKGKDRGEEKSTAVVSKGLCESLRAAPSLQRFLAAWEESSCFTLSLLFVGT